jgi:hypothetical protein
MELFDRQLQAKQGLPWRGRVWVRCKDFAPRRSIQKQLCTVLAGAVAVVFGPEALVTIAHASAVLIEILMGVCRTCLPVLRILGI